MIKIRQLLLHELSHCPRQNPNDPNLNLSNNQAASSDLKQLGFSVATRGMESAVEELSQLLNASSQLVESDDRPVSILIYQITVNAIKISMIQYQVAQLEHDEDAAVCLHPNHRPDRG